MTDEKEADEHRLVVRVPVAMLAKIDRFAEDAGIKRSRMVRILIERQIELRQIELRRISEELTADRAGKLR